MSKSDKTESSEQGLDCDTFRTLLQSGRSVSLNDKIIGGPSEEYKNFRCVNKRKGGILFAFERQKIENKWGVSRPSSYYSKYDPRVFHVMANVSPQAKLKLTDPLSMVDIEDPHLEFHQEVNIPNFKSR